MKLKKENKILEENDKNLESMIKSNCREKVKKDQLTPYPKKKFLFI